MKRKRKKKEKKEKKGANLFFSNLQRCLPVWRSLEKESG
jgi:hypothetical protein